MIAGGAAVAGMVDSSPLVTSPARGCRRGCGLMSYGAATVSGARLTRGGDVWFTRRDDDSRTGLVDARLNKHDVGRTMRRFGCQIRGLFL